MAGRNHDYFFWTDLECTGSEDFHSIVEIGYAITDKNLEVLEGGSIVLPFPPDAREHPLVKDVVRNMHDKNGLWLDATRVYGENPYHTDALKKADDYLSGLVIRYNGMNHMAFCGSGVSHYDRKFIKRDLPKLNDRLTYWAIDIGAVRRAYEYFGHRTNWLVDNKTHRAYDDVLFHIAETKYFIGQLKEET